MERKKKRWMIAVFFFLAGILAASWSSRIPDVQRQLGLNNAAWGTVLVSMPAGLVTGLFLSSWLVARFGTPKVIIVTCIFASCLLFLLGIADGRFQLMIVLFFVGFIRTIMNIAINTNSVEVQKEYKKPIISTFHGIWSAACLVAAGIGQLMIICNIIPAIHFASVAVLCIAAAWINRINKNNEAHIVPDKKPFLVRPDRYLFLLGLITFCAMAAENTVFDWGINYFDKMVHADKKWVTAGYTSFIATMALGRLLGDKLIHHYGHIKMLILNGILMAAGFAIVSLFPFLLTSAFGFLLIGFGDSTIVPVVYSLAARSIKMPPSYAIAAVTTIGYTGFLLNPLIVGFISEEWNMRWAFGLMVVFALFISLIAFLVKKYLITLS